MYTNLIKVILKAFKVKIFTPGTLEMGAQRNECFTSIIVMLSFRSCTGNYSLFLKVPLVTSFLQIWKLDIQNNYLIENNHQSWFFKNKTILNPQKWVLWSNKMKRKQDGSIYGFAFMGLWNWMTLKLSFSGYARL